jgi:hypothetical protein
MSSMYLYWARQSSEEFSALETSCIAISFLSGAARSDVTAAAAGEAAASASPHETTSAAPARASL